MLDPVRAKLKWVGVTAAAFAGGVALASGLEWTPASQAASLLQQPPSRADVRPVADLSEAFISIAGTVTPAVVAIETERTAPGGARGRVPDELREMFPQFRLPDDHPDIPQQSSGSGFLITQDGYIVTNNHVVQGATRITVVLGDNRSLDARLVGRDPNTDIAVIKVEGSGFPTVRMGRSDETRIGEWVLAIGNPLDLGTTVTSGIVSAKGRALPILRNTSGSNWAIEDFLQTDAPINPGNSGGPLVNLRGEVVGVNSAIASPTGFYSGYGFAVPIDLARRIADDLIRYGVVKRPALGVSVRLVSPEDAEVFGLPRIAGVVAQDFPESSPARRAGLRQGDVIVAVDGQPVERVGQFQRLVAQYRPGETVTLDVVRYGERRTVRVELMEAPIDERTRVAAAPPAAAAPTDDARRLGVEVGPLDAERAREYGYRDTGGVVLTRVDPAGAGSRGGLTPGMRLRALDGQAVGNVEDFRRLMERKRAGEIATVVVGFPDGGQALYNIRLP